MNLDGVSVLLDGVCKELPPYLGTPENIKTEIVQSPPDIVAFTHMHDDHYDGQFAKTYKELTLRSIFGPGFSIFGRVGDVTISGVETRHIGKSDVPHMSFAIKGSRCVWFVGDASPLQWKNISKLPKPDVLIVPYAYAITDSAWKLTKELGAETVILLHMPAKNNDEYELWKQVEKTTQNDEKLLFLDMGETAEI